MLTYTALLGLITLPVTLGIEGGTSLSYATVAIILFGLVISQDVLVSDINTDGYTDLTELQKLITIGGAFILYNMIILLSVYVGLVFETVGGATTGILAAAAYPLWEHVTGRIPLPLSFTGIVASFILVLGVVGVIGSKLYERIQEVGYLPLRYFDMRRFGGAGRPG